MHNQDNYDNNIYEMYGVSRKMANDLNIDELNNNVDVAVLNNPAVDVSGLYVIESISGKQRERVIIKDSCFYGGGLRNFKSKETVFVNCIFSTCVFDDVETADIKFILCKFEDTRFSNSNLFRASFMRCSGVNAKFTKCNLNNSRWIDTPMSGFDINQGANILSRCDVKEMYVSSVQKDFTELEAEVVTAGFTADDLEQNVVEKKIFKDTTIKVQDLFRISFEKCDFEYVEFQDDVNATDLWWTNRLLGFKDCNFNNCTFANEGYFKTDFEDCLFFNTKLKSNFVMCRFNKIKFEKVSVSETCIFNDSIFIESDLGDWDFLNHKKENMYQVSIGVNLNQYANDKQYLNELAVENEQLSKDLELLETKIEELGNESATIEDNSGYAKKLIGIILNDYPELQADFTVKEEVIRETAVDESKVITFLSGLNEVERMKLVTQTFVVNHGDESNAETNDDEENQGEKL